MRLAPLVAALFLLAVPSAMSAQLAPPNDDFADAVSLETTGGFVRANNVNATAETGEPAHAGQAAVKSIWYSWTAPLDGSIPHVAFIAGGDFDTLLAVYTGATVGALTPVASNDDVAGFGAYYKRVRDQAWPPEPGDYIGQNYGKIIKISETDVALREIVQDAAGEWIERTSALQLQEKAR